MPYDPERHHRRSIRLQGYDYAQAGAYFVTICAQGRECLFGEVVDGTVRLSAYGRLVVACWDGLPGRFPTLDLDAGVVMPNHLHGIVVLSEPASDASGRPPQACGSKGGETPPLPAHPAVGAGSPRPGRGNDANPSSAPDSPPPPPTTVQRPTLAHILAYFKYQSTKTINQARGTPGRRVWQRNYYEHVIRDERSLDRLRRYVLENPLRWEWDKLHPDQPSAW